MSRTKKTATRVTKSKASSAKIKKRTSSKKEMESYSHKGAKRKNNPPVGLVSSVTDKLNGQTVYQHDPYIDPHLSWAGKTEGLSFNVQNVSLHVHERIDSKRIAQAFLKRAEKAHELQLSLFDQPENEPPLNKAVDFYRHEQDWTNRLIAGDSLLVMNSLLHKEGMAGKVQMVYIDPPYGIKYNSNFQPFVNKRDVKDGKDESIPAEPEMIQAFRDTWELGVHSYLTHLRNRLLLAKELLNESGSCLVQISDENFAFVRNIMAEIFGEQNFVTNIAFKTKLPLGSTNLSCVYDHIVWFAKDIKKLKFNRLWEKRSLENNSEMSFVELPDGSRRKLSKEEKVNNKLLPTGSKIFQRMVLSSAGKTESCVFPFEFEGEVFNPIKNRSWKTNLKGMQALAEKKRLFKLGNSLYYVLFYDDFPVVELTNMWSDTTGGYTDPKIYVVQTSPKPIQRCMLMATDPGDLVFDPTCGSGTTARVAEQWGRRWITCDTSRVAVTLAKQRLMTGQFDYYELAHPDEGIRSGFKYKTVPHITLGAIANNQPKKEEILYDQPIVERNKVRVTGPFTVEAVPCLRIKPFDGKEPKFDGAGADLARTGGTGQQALWRDELKTSGIRGVGGVMINFSRIEPMAATRFLHAEGEILDEKGCVKKAVISFGPQFGPLEQRQVEGAVKEAKELKSHPEFIVFAAFHFDPEAAKDIDQMNDSIGQFIPGAKILKAQMSVDLLTHDLRKKRSSNQSYWLIGQPEIEVKKIKDGRYKVSVHGFDYYDPISGEILSGNNKHIAMWFLDTDYDERSLMPDQVFFPAADAKRDWTKLAKVMNGEVDEDLLDTFRGTESLEFDSGNQRKIAVKIIDNRGIESFVVKSLV